MEVLFISSVFLVLFAYFGYPVTLILLGRLRGRDVNRAIIFPSVTFIVTVHNEEKRVKEKLENTLNLDYPRDRLEIFVASDGSSDRTNEIVLGYQNQGIQLLDIADRRGKENAQKEAVKKATGEIIVFSDVATMLGVKGCNNWFPIFLIRLSVASAVRIAYWGGMANHAARGSMCVTRCG